jgi:hypothetical protein
VRAWCRNRNRNKEQGTRRKKMKEKTDEMKKWELVQRILAILNELEEEDEYQLKKDKDTLLRVAREMVW